jgi:hypothetical protein
MYNAMYNFKYIIIGTILQIYLTIWNLLYTVYGFWWWFCLICQLILSLSAIDLRGCSARAGCILDHPLHIPYTYCHYLTS